MTYLYDKVQDIKKLKRGNNMNKFMKYITVRRYIALLMAVFMLIGTSFIGFRPVKTSAASQDNEEQMSQTQEDQNEETQPTLNIDGDRGTRSLGFTTDWHGGVGRQDLNAGTEFGNIGLARAINLIREKRLEMDSENVFTFDTGDIL